MSHRKGFAAGLVALAAAAALLLLRGGEPPRDTAPQNRSAEPQTEREPDARPPEQDREVP